MGRPPDFIGLGAQKAGTSWIYSCLYEHPQLCLPLKEIHFFSRQRNWSKGYEWYEAIFEQCSPETKTGEFSNSYLTDPSVPARIHQRYPHAKLIASLRNPVERAYSNYLHQIKKGTISRDVPFEEALKDHSEYIEQGRYATQLGQYLSLFPREQILLLIYEDCLHQPLEFMQSLYAFLKVDSHFIPSLLNTKVNVSIMPRSVLLERSIIKISGFLHHKGFRHLWWFAKKLGIANYIRKLNTFQSQKHHMSEIDVSWKTDLYRQLEQEIRELETLLGRGLPEWRI